MNYEQLLKLVDAGFTKDEILSFAKPAVDSVSKTDEQKGVAPVKNMEATGNKITGAEAEQVKHEFDFRKAFDDVQSRIDALCKSMISNNISTATQPTNTENSVSDILKGLF